MKANGWTGGQYSLFRFALGIYLALHFSQLAPWGAEVFSGAGVIPRASDSPLSGLFPNVLLLWDGPVFVTAILWGAAGMALAFAWGWRDRVFAVLLWYVWACLLGRNPLISNPGLPYVGWILLAHACLPRAPYLSWEARKRADPAGGWAMPQSLFIVAWILMALGYSYSGWTKLDSPSWLDGSALSRVLENPLARPGALRGVVLSLPPGLLRGMTWASLALELGFAPLVLFRRLRPWVWLAMLGMHAGLVLLLDFADLSFGMVMLHAFTFDPAWIRPRGTAARIFYDGGCGLCHRWVRFVLAEDREGVFRFAPLGGAAFLASVPQTSRENLPDSLVVEMEGGVLLSRSAAVLAILARLGGVWGILSGVGGMFPAGFLDLAYDAVARVRRRIFSPPSGACPLLPRPLAVRFLP